MSDWTSMLPSGQMPTPVVPNWERPHFNQVGAMQAAQQYLTNQQALDTAKAEAPLRLKVLQNDVGQLDTSNALKAAQLHSAQRADELGAATQPDAIAAEGAALREKIATATQGMDDAQVKAAWTRAQIFDKSTTFLESKSPEELPSALAATEKQLRDMGVPDDTIATWKEGLSDPTARSLYHSQAKQLDEIMSSRAAINYGGGAYGAQVRGSFQLRTAAQTATDQALKNGDIKPEQADAFYEQVYSRLVNSGGGAAVVTPAPDAAAGSIVDDSAKAAEKIAPKKSKSITPAVAKSAADHPDAAVYEGPMDAPSVAKWFNDLPLNAPFIDPKSGTYVPHKRAHIE